MNWQKGSKVATLIIFLALIRCIAEPFRLQYYSANSLSFPEIKPFLIGALIAAIGLLVMIILNYSRKYKAISAIAVLTVIALVLVKIYGMPS